MDWLAAAEGGVDIGGLAQYGVLGIFAILLILFARISYKRETDRSDRAEAEIARLNAWLQEKAIPALLASARANEDSQELLREMYQSLRDLPRRPSRRPPGEEETP